ncbi:MAG: TonB C-terminal domain-containing protein [Verrucomicrobia bacterium]|nr:TonB C-terminal domain-containing protein [Verrucomicrobiota bacterium]MBT4227858.1 TonB C-terminal domain-containing protein [Verrucomicrobiota bacterium]MBT4902516.1 TonB C-terminal domain-containing protein [Verrucomicrobiota bacterium]MBT6660969.1 TonB C-terminal domain-containing protein [Verrucomicrobiota bacterium]MBT7027236.1 TonB C-terminal domain-containing protein [Verrucomicrobiota bacterium]
MSRLKRSCVVGSVVFHALILAMLVLGPMLLAKREEKVRVIDLVPSAVIDKLLAPAVPSAPPPAPAPPKPKQPEPKKVQTKPKPKPIPAKPKKITPKPKPKPKPTPPKPKIKVNLNSNVRKPDAQKNESQKKAAKRQAALNKLQAKLSGRTSVNVPIGRYASANYESLIRKKYMDATIHPGSTSGDPVVKVRLVIARNGTVLSARVTGKSGVASWDRSVQKALDRVKFIKPFPEAMKGSQQTFNLNFNSRSFS